MERIVLVGNIFNFNESLTFVLQLVGFEVRQVKDVEEAINFNEIHRCLKGGFDLLVIKNSEFVNRWPSFSEILTALMQKTKVLRIVKGVVANQDRAALSYLDPAGKISVYNATDIVVEIKRIFARS